MAGIQPISGSIPPIQPQTHAPAAGGERAPAKTGASFGQMLDKAVGGIDRQQQESAIAIQDLLAGRTQDVLPVVSAVAQADLSFKLLIGIRNKVIEAYKQTMNMQI